VEGAATPHEDLVERFCGILPEAAERIRAAAASYAKWWVEEFSREHDPSRILGESNVFRYRRRGTILVRCDGMSPGDVALVMLALKTCGVPAVFSAGEGRGGGAALAKVAGFPCGIESEVLHCGWLAERGGEFARLRVVAPSDGLRRTAVEIGLEVHDWPVLANGRIELWHYLREQAVTETRHRYGNIIMRP
jgi:RHH-type proline utilization regulon transcriptional repressor/proline dehydrogenase/delta 1-pyrroline-5-carboxylate dehydrogenase